MPQSIYLLLIGIFLYSYSNLSAQRYVDTVNVVQAYEVPIYKADSSQKQVFIQMAYASSEMKNPEAWTKIAEKNFPIEVDLVYTKYPANYDKWLTNYDKLLNARIRNLIELDPIFRAVDVKWNVVIQTNCKTADDAKAMLHGIVIKYQPRDLVIVNTKIDPKDARPKIITPAAVPSVPKEFSSAAATSLEIPPKPIYGSDVSDIDDIKNILRGELIIQDSTVMTILSRHPEWKNSLIVMDWTASMYQYGAQLLMWHRLNLEKNISQVSHFVFFNDGNSIENGRKKYMIGNTGGIYKATTNSLQDVIRVMQSTMAGGTGGDIEENDLEAVLYGINKIKDFDDIILIADNTLVRDIELLSKIKQPIHVIICDSHENLVQAQYLKIAFETGGSVHTLKEDIMTLAQLVEDNALTQASGKYEMRDGHLVKIADAKDKKK